MFMSSSENSTKLKNDSIGFIRKLQFVIPLMPLHPYIATLHAYNMCVHVYIHMCLK